MLLKINRFVFNVLFWLKGNACFYLFFSFEIKFILALQSVFQIKILCHFLPARDGNYAEKSANSALLEQSELN